MRLDDNLIKGRKKVHSLSTLRAEVLFRIMHVKEELRERERERERERCDTGKRRVGTKRHLALRPELSCVCETLPYFNYPCCKPSNKRF